MPAQAGQGKGKDNTMIEKETVLPWDSPQFYRQAHAIGAQRVRFMEHRGRKILFVDFSKAELDVIRAVAAECLHVMMTQPPLSVLSLVEMEGIPFSTEALKIGSELTEKGQNYSLRTAVSPVVGFRSFLLQTVADASKRPIKLFKEREKALEWLVSEDGDAGTGR
jgi:hypothetical protein